MKPGRRIERARKLCQREGLPQDNPDILLLILDEMRSANFRLAVLIGANGVLIALILALLLGRL